MHSNFTFIHIGKCGGSSVTNTLKENKFHFNKAHTDPVGFNPKEKYLIVLRNPVERFISAFYWRKKILKKKERDGTLSSSDLIESELYKQYPDLNTLCRDIFHENFNLNKPINHRIQQIYIGKSARTGKLWRHPSHLAMGIDWYIGGLIKHLSRYNVKIMCTETLAKDMKNFFNITLKHHFKKNDKYKLKTTNESRSILEKYLVKDFNCIDQLYNMGLLSSGQYKILNKNQSQ